MDDLFFLRELIRIPESRGHNSGVNNIFRRTGFDVIFEFVAARAAHPGSVVAIAPSLRLFGESRFMHVYAPIHPSMVFLGGIQG